jgi:tRNA (adenine-N(1)-)-methyltransferase non-catalytic subunit
MVDDTGGLVIASMADRMGILYPEEGEQDEEPRANGSANLLSSTGEEPEQNTNGQDRKADLEEDDEPIPPKHAERPSDSRITPMSAKTNTITLIHANAQPNLSLLKYFSFDSNNPNHSHPLFTHLKTLSWLQLLSPNEDTGYTEPERIPEESLKTFKSGKRGNYYRKRRRWERVKAVVDETRAGGFDGLIVASSMDPTTILQHTIPLLRGAAQVVVYSPYIEPVAELADLHSSARRSAFISNPPDQHDLPNEDFPLNPTLLLGTMVQTVRMRPWQCLPGRTHPIMTGQGGAEGYLFTGTKVLPVEGKIEARGKFKRRKVVEDEGELGKDSSVVEREKTGMDSITAA